MAETGDRAAWLCGPDCHCNRTDPRPARPVRLVLLGAPGVGKGTQAELLCERLGACQLSTGDVFRAVRQVEDAGALSPALRQALELMRSGQLVSDETVIDMVREREHCLACEYGFLLDGFPRTAGQAEALAEMLAQTGIELDAVINYTLPTDEIVSRLSGRRTCRDCKTTFHIKHKPPRKEGVCDKCGGALYQREDDQPEAIRVRLEAYAASTAPLTAYYESKGLLCSVSAEGDAREVYARTIEQLNAVVADLPA